MSSPPLWSCRRVRRWLLLLALAYPAYLLFLGPFYALDGRGCFDFAPACIRTAFYFPCAPFYWTMGSHNPYDDYLTWWYDDPNAAETTD